MVGHQGLLENLRRSCWHLLFLLSQEEASLWSQGPQRGGMAVSARQRTQLLRAPHDPGFPMVALAVATAAAAGATAAPASGGSLGLSTWSGEQLRASFR